MTPWKSNGTITQFWLRLQYLSISCILIEVP
jgi:hypothetical protein